MPDCPECNSEYSYIDGLNYICPECGYEWSSIHTDDNSKFVVKDSNGLILESGDNVIVIKDLKVKGSSSVVKVGTKIKNIRIIESADNHHIDVKVAGIGQIKITPKFVKKA